MCIKNKLDKLNQSLSHWPPSAFSAERLNFGQIDGQSDGAREAPACSGNKAAIFTRRSPERCVVQCLACREQLAGVRLRAISCGAWDRSFALSDGSRLYLQLSLSEPTGHLRSYGFEFLGR